VVAVDQFDDTDFYTVKRNLVGKAMAEDANNKSARALTKNPVLSDILRELAQKDEQERCAFPYWGNWGNWSNWSNWSNWGNWINGQ